MPTVALPPTMLKNYKRATPACTRCYGRRVKCIDVPGVLSCLKCLQDDAACEPRDGTGNVHSTSGKPRPRPRPKTCCSACTRSKTRCSRDPSAPCQRCSEKGLSCSFISDQREGKSKATVIPQFISTHAINEDPSRKQSVIPAIYPLKLTYIRLPKPPTRTLLSTTPVFAGVSLADFIASRTSTPPSVSAKQSGTWSACYTCAEKKAVACVDVSGTTSCIRCAQRAIVCERPVDAPATREPQQTATGGGRSVSSSTSRSGVGVGISGACVEGEQGLIIESALPETITVRRSLLTSTVCIELHEAVDLVPRVSARRTWWEVCMDVSPKKQA
ncbi:hypothetical protein L226DRAFT_183607 [Lentinus tigrinus ALCF2SS1-7]|uniref:uncharacterized protein n=1 Tax=Lentinus tigrinus ALCF2SS1-7 TaxID=1328758 RepID=UPI001165DD60|nr:hypothetical protein L226DRAFT_183607 [Lentinus tigrinus ALCF2SS1-7]